MTRRPWSCRPRSARPGPVPPGTSARHRSRAPHRAMSDRSRLERRPPPPHPPRRMPAAVPPAEDERSAGSAGRVAEHLLPRLDERPGSDDAPRDVAGPECLLGCELGTEQVSTGVRGRSDDRHQDQPRPGRSRCRQEVCVAFPVDLVGPLTRDRRGARGSGDHCVAPKQSLSQAIGTAYVDLHDVRPLSQHLPARCVAGRRAPVAPSSSRATTRRPSNPLHPRRRSRLIAADLCPDGVSSRRGRVVVDRLEVERPHSARSPRDRTSLCRASGGGPTVEPTPAHLPLRPERGPVGHLPEP